MNTSRIDGSALTALLATAGLLHSGPAAQAGRLAGRFPARVGRDLFLEYEFGDVPAAAGFGLGFPAYDLDFYQAVEHWFMKTPPGRALRLALADDPFAADHVQHLNLFGDSDPDWVEFDIADGRIDDVPFVFFRPPSRFRVVSTIEEARALCLTLPGRSATGELAGLLERLLAVGPVTPYRFGVARSRGDGWQRAILTHLEADQVLTTLRDLAVADFEAPIVSAARLYAASMDSPGAAFALSVDLQNERITAIDVECPYLFRIADPAARVGPLANYAREIADAGVISPAIAAWISENTLRDVTLSPGGAGLRIMLHHLKFRVLGAPHLRTKAYLHLSLGQGRASEAPA